MSGKVVDLFLTYQFLKRLATPFDKWDAFKYGIIDADGAVLRKSDSFKTDEERNSWGYFDRLVANLKKLLAKVPGGKSKIATYAAALLLVKENNNIQHLSDEELELFVEENFHAIYSQLNEEGEAAPANVASGGKIAGIGVGPQGEPGIKKKKKPNPVIAKMLRRKTPNVDPKIPT